MSSIYDKSSLVLIPSGTKVSKVYSQKPVSGDGDFTFTRSSAATRVNADGNIEKETQNLLPYSNTFNQWSPVAGTLSQGVTDPFGSNTAWSWTALNTDPYMYSQTAWSGLVTLSIWAKGVGSSIGKDFEFRLGGILQSFTLTSEWQRFEFFANGSAATIGFEVGNPAVSGDVVHIYGAQLEYGLVARDYIETTTAAVYGGITDNTPRLDYTDSSCPALLLEPLRTNIVTQSEYFEAWTSTALSSRAISSTLSPEGYNNAYELIEDNTNSYHRVYENFSYTSGSTYSFSVFAKSGNGSRRLGLLFGCGFGEDEAVFDLTTGQVTQESNGGTGTIVDMGNGWYKCTMTATANNSGSSCAQIQLRDGDLQGYLGDNSSSILIYGATLEAGTYPTSYIPTYGSSVTRNRDRCSENGLSALIGQSEGTIYWEGSFQPNSNPILLQLAPNSGNYTSTIYIEFAGSQIRIRVYDSGTQQAYFTTSATAGTQYKIALAYKENDVKGYVNGTSIGTDTSATIQNGLSNVHIGELRGSSLDAFNGTMPKQVMLFKTRLSNEELADLTIL